MIRPLIEEFETHHFEDNVVRNCTQSASESPTSFCENEAQNLLFHWIKKNVMKKRLEK